MPGAMQSAGLARMGIEPGLCGCASEQSIERGAWWMDPAELQTDFDIDVCNTNVTTLGETLMIK